MRDGARELFRHRMIVHGMDIILHKHRLANVFAER
jgi:hypothetical protein